MEEEGLLPPRPVPAESPLPTELDGRVGAKILATNHCFDPTMPPTAGILHRVENNGRKGSAASESLDAQGAQHHYHHQQQHRDSPADEIGIHMADINVTAIKRSSSLALDGDVMSQKPRLGSMSDQDSGELMVCGCWLCRGCDACAMRWA